MILRLCLCLLVSVFTLNLAAQKQWRAGLYYSFGGAFNFHRTNESPLKLSDGSSLGVITRLDNGDRALGFQAALGLKWNDVRHKIEDQFYLDNGFKAVELRLQCTMPVSRHSTLALGMAPRLVYRDSFNMVYLNSVNGAQSEYGMELTNDSADLNELNSAIIFSWQYELHKRWFFHLNIDQDMLPAYAGDVPFEDYDQNQATEPPVTINSLFTTISGSIVFMVK